MTNNIVESNKLRNSIHTGLILLSMGTVLGVMGWMIAGADGMKFSLIFSALIFIFTPKLPLDTQMRSYGAKKVGPGTLPELSYITRVLSEKAGLKNVPDIYYINSAIPNAFAAGSRDRSAIGITDGILRNLNREEIIGIMAHEITHIKNNDVKYMGLANLISRVTGYISLVGQIIFVLSLPLLLFSEVTIPFWPFMFIIFAPHMSVMLNLALSRTREFEADLGSSILTGEPAYLASALNKLERFQRMRLRNYLIPGYNQSQLLRTHPATRQRIEKLMELKGSKMKKHYYSNSEVPQRVYVRRFYI